MAGMLQIITYLLCAYLVFKGVEIFQIGLMTANEKRASAGIVIGVIAVAISIVAAFAFTSWIDSQALSMSDSMKSIPSLR
jgi:hypothetical protein